jgi:glycosyltransferase involved in cell wall biosynthesis
MPLPADRRPLICILDGSVGVTGALMAARREAALLKDRARFLLVVPEDNRLDSADLPEFERIERLSLHPLRRNIRDATAYLPSVWKAAHKLSNLLQETRCTRLQVNDFYLIQGWIARRFGYRGTIATWVRIDPHRFGLAGRFWLNGTIARSDHVVAVSSFIKSRLPSKARALIIHDPAPPVTPLPFPGASARFVFIGNLIEGKGHNVAIAAFHRVASRHPTAELILHGATLGLTKNEAYRQRLMRLASEGAGASRIHFRGFAKPSEALRPALAALNCSISESFSLACQEASAFGRPVIATRSGGPEEIIEDGQTGYLIPVGDAEAIADRMNRLLDDHALAEKMGREGAALVRNRFGADDFRDRLSAIFNLGEPHAA